jgi:hypothetical protein
VRRLIFLVTAALLLAGRAAASAATLETGGEFRARAWSLDNYLKDGARTEFWDQRLRLSMAWPVTETVRIQARADLLEGAWGEPLPAAAGPRPPAPPGAPPAGPPALPERQAVAFDHLNLQFVWPGAPVRLTIGRQDVSWGTGLWVQADNRDRFQVAAKLESTVVVAAYDKFTEVLELHGVRDDWRAWAIGAVTDVAGFKLGLLVAYTLDGSHLVFPKGDFEYVATSLFATGTAGPVGLKAEVLYGSGALDREDGSGRLDLSGLGAYAGAFVPVGPALTIGVEGAYARGDDPKTTGENEGLFAADYQGPYSSLIFYNAMDVAGYAGDAQTSDPVRDTSVRNAVTGKISAALAAAKRLTVTGAALYAAADRTAPGVDPAMGWEFDLQADYGVVDGVTLSAGVGYAVLGDYWRTAPIAGGGGAKPENPLVVVVAVTSKF